MKDERNLSDEEKRGVIECPFMNIVVKNVVIPLNSWSSLQIMKIRSHARRVVTVIPAGLCLRFHVDRPRETEFSAAIYPKAAHHHPEGFPEHLSPCAAVSCDCGS
jgi:hypothetical protein